MDRKSDKEVIGIQGDIEEDLDLAVSVHHKR